MPDIQKEPSQPILAEVADSKAPTVELSEESKSLLAAYQEDMKAEREMLNRLFGDEMYPLKKETEVSTEQTEP